MNLDNIFKYLLDFLIERDYDANFKLVNTGFTALHTACYFGKDEVINVMIQQDTDKIDFFAKEKSDSTPLHIGCRYGNAKVIDMLVEHLGPNVLSELGKHGMGEYGWSPLHYYACHGGKVEIVKTMINLRL